MTENVQEEVTEAVQEQPQPSQWVGVPLCEIPPDAKGPEGEDVWEGIKEITGKDRQYFIDLQAKNMKKNGKPRNLHLILLGDLPFVVRELNQGDYREITRKCAKDERDLINALRIDEPEAMITAEESNYIEFVNTLNRATVFPEGFDFTDDELPYLLVPALYEKVMMLAGTMDQVVVKKL
jgi:hypothetical protein